MNEQRAQVDIAAFADAKEAGLPPLECCRSTSPSQAESCWPLAKLFASAMGATRALASSGPIPGIPSFMLSSLLRCHVV